MVHIPVQMGGQDVTTTIPHPSIPDFEVFYNESLEGCDIFENLFTGNFISACVICENTYGDCQ